MALIRMCVVPNCSQRLSRPILWIVTVCATYWTYGNAVCVLMVALTRLQLPTHSATPRPIQPAPLIRVICDVTVAVKNSCSKSSKVS